MDRKIFQKYFVYSLDGSIIGDVRGADEVVGHRESVVVSKFSR